jgi:DNA-binding NarL/FixJ family response regulator
MRVAIADDFSLFRKGLAMLLRGNHIEVTAEAGTGEELLARVRDDPPDAVILDIRMPPSHTDEGIRTAVALREEHPDLGILVLSQFAEAGLAQTLLATVKRGVGYLLKDTTTDLPALTRALRQVIDGRSAVDPVIVEALLERKRSGLGDLSARELDVLRLMAQGRSNLGIAQELGLARKTIENHVTDIFIKLGLDHRRLTENTRVRAVLAFLHGTAHA